MSRWSLSSNQEASGAVVRTATTTSRAGAVASVVIFCPIQRRVAVSMPMSSGANWDRVALDYTIMCKAGGIHAVIC